MQVNQSLLKLVIRILILMILFTMLYIISIFLYSIKYWPDFNNLIHKNITIKHIPTISELNLTVFDVETNTEVYTTTDTYDATTSDDIFELTFGDIDEIEFPSPKIKRSIKIEDTNKDYNEVPRKSVIVDYFFDYRDETTKVMEDSVDESKLTTQDSGVVEVFKKMESLVHDCHGNATTMADAVFPWIVTIFHKNGNTDQFEYFCDGVLLNENAVLTSARCVSSSGAIADPGQLIVILGKRNLKIMHEHEIVVRVSKLIVHPNFHEPSSDGFVEDDLAIVILDSIVPMSSSIRAACLDCLDCGGVEQAATTGWALTGELTPIFFAKEEKEFDITSKKIEGTYGLDVSVCPSHGGIYFVQLQGAWYVRGVSASNPNDQGLCIIRTLDYTSLRTYMDWISGVISKAD